MIGSVVSKIFGQTLRLPEDPRIGEKFLFCVVSSQIQYS